MIKFSHTLPIKIFRTSSREQKLFKERNLSLEIHFIFFTDLQVFKSAAEELFGRYTFAFATGSIAKERYKFDSLFPITGTLLALVIFYFFSIKYESGSGLYLKLLWIGLIYFG